MFKKHGNPKIDELIQTYKKRGYCLSSLKVVEIDGKRYCAWCAAGEPFKNKQRKYCSTECQEAAMAFAYPQKEENLGLLLHRQDWYCNVCKFDYRPYIEMVLRNLYGDKPPPFDYRTKFNWTLMKRLKYITPKDKLPEVDHIIPISKGGISLGNSNHCAICRACHKAKTKIDNSGPRKKKSG